MWNFLADLREAIDAIFRMENTMSELSDTLVEIRDAVAKVKGEFLGKIADLEASLANAGNLSDADRALLQDIKSGLDDMDSIVPDQPPAEPTV